MTRLCSLCRQPGHYATTCPTVPSTSRGERIEVLATLAEVETIDARRGECSRSDYLLRASGVRVVVPHA